MAHYTAVLIHGERGGEGTHTFEGPDDLMKRSPVKVMRAFMDYIDTHAHLGHVEYEINAAMKNKKVGVVTVLGELGFSEDNVQPFVCMITAAKTE